MLKHLKGAAVNSLIYSFGNLSTKIVGLILIPIYVKHLTVADYGVLGVLEATSYTLVILFGFQLFMAFFRWYWDKEYDDRRKSMFFTVMAFLAITSVFFCIILFPVAGNLSEFLFNKPDYTYLIKLTIVGATLQILTNNPGILMRLQEKAFLYMITSTARLIVNLGLTVLLIVYYNRGLEGIFEAQIVGSLVYIVMIIPFMVKNMEWKFDRKLLIGMLIFSSPTIISGLSTVIISISDRYFLNFSSGLDNAGLYSFGYKIANTINVLVAASISMAIMPIIYKLIDDRNNKRFYAKTLTYTSYILIFLSLSFSIFGMEIVKVLSKQNPNYWLSFQVIPILCLGIVFCNMRDNVMNGLNIVKKTKVIAGTVVVSSLINIVLNYILITRFDYIGAAVASMLTYLISFLLMYFFSQKYYPIPFEKWKLALMIAVYIVLSVIAFSINHTSLSVRLGVKSFLFLSFPFILYIFGFYEPVELDRLKGFWEKWKNPVNWFKNIKTIE